MRNLRSRYCSLGKQFGAPDLTMLRYQIWILRPNMVKHATKYHVHFFYDSGDVLSQSSNINN